MAANILALVAILAVGARTSPVIDNTILNNFASESIDFDSIESKENEEDVSNYLQQVLNSQVQDIITPFEALRRSNHSNSTNPGRPAVITPPAPNTALTGSTIKLQRVTFAITEAQFNTAGVKLSIEIGYGTYLTIYADGSWVSSNGVTGSVSAAIATRRAITLVMTTVVPNSHLAAVNAQQTNLQNDAGGALATLATHIATALASNNVTGITVSVTGAQAASVSSSSPTPTPTSSTTSGASQAAILSLSAMAALVLVLKH